MQITIHHPCSEMHDAVLRYVEQRVRSVLSQFTPYIMHVALYLEEAGHLRAGGGIHCRMVVAVLGAGHISADLLDARLIVAIDRALDHIAHTLVRDFDRPRIPTIALPAPVRLTPATVFRRYGRQDVAEQSHLCEEFPSFVFDFV